MDTYIRMRACHRERKVTLSIEEEVLREAKVVASLEGKSLSGLVEEYLESLASSRWLERLAAGLGIERLEPTSEGEIPSRRLEGFNVAHAVREDRRSREERIFIVNEELINESHVPGR